MKNIYLAALLWVVIVACERSPETPERFAEKYRPQFHFTPPAHWMNDPNGMFYLDDKYHLFFQYYPDSNVWGPMHWGHAVSSDMMKWEHLPVALFPDSLGYIFSGSAVVDWNNTSGLGSGQQPPVIAIFTYHQAAWVQAGRLDFQNQGIAYSQDGGYTWHKYDQNPVLRNAGSIDFRDPKVFWHEPTSQWIMILAVYDHVSFYTSPDLKNWTWQSDFGKHIGGHGGVWECPDLFPLVVEGTSDTLWTLLLSINPGGPQGGSATQYFLGSFDGSKFTLDPDFAKQNPTIAPVFPEGEVFEDFETDYGKWKISGEAFGSEPAKGRIGNQNEVTEYEGMALANSYQGSDAKTGSLISAPFEIKRPYIHFLLGGGSAGSGVYAGLEVDGEMVFKSSGRNGEPLEAVSWAVADLIGKTARIHLVDEGTGIWGHLTADQFVFADQPVIPESNTSQWVDMGADNYAGVTWAGVPATDGRRLFLGWMSNWLYAQQVPTYKWRSGMTLPRELSLRKVNGQIRLISIPAKEVHEYDTAIQVYRQGNVYEFTDSTLHISLREIQAGTRLQFANQQGEQLEIGFMHDSIYIDRRGSGLASFYPDFAAVHSAPFSAPNIADVMLYLDVNSLEMFVNDGALVMSELIFPTSPYHRLTISGDADSITFYKMRRVWE